CRFFFFQAEDGIRDFHVTGVQTCALPILICRSAVDSTVRKVVTLKARYGDDVDVINILFLGNSHTYYNDVPGLVEGIGKAAGKEIGRASCRERVAMAGGSGQLKRSGNGRT